MKKAENVQDQEPEGRPVRKLTTGFVVVTGHQGDHRLANQGFGEMTAKKQSIIVSSYHRIFVSS